MARLIKPRLRYFARFKEDFGYLRAVIRNGKVRKYIVTPIVVSKEQLSRLDTSGSMIKKTVEDFMVNTRLREFTKIIWDTVTPLIESGEFDTMPSWRISHAIYEEKRAWEKARTDRNLTRLGFDVTKLAPGYELPGFHYGDGRMMSPADEDKAIALINSILNGGEGEKGGNNGMD